MIHSEKTKTGIAKAKAAGIKWGRNGSVLAKKNRNTAQNFAEGLRPTILNLMLNSRSAKGRGPSALAERLNALGVATALRGKWHPATVCRLMKRLQPDLSQAFKKAHKAKGEKFLKENLDPGIAGHIHRANGGV